MKKRFCTITVLIIASFAIISGGCEKRPNQTKQEAAVVAKQKAQYAKGQPIPSFDWSMERHLMIELYKLRNKKVSTHAVWRSDRGLIEGDCPSMGFGLPYDVSLTNPLTAVDFGTPSHYAWNTVEQEEPNGIFASKNTAATWVMCIGDAGLIEPIYIETKVTVYPYPVNVDYAKNRVTKAGKATVNISTK